MPLPAFAGPLIAGGLGGLGSFFGGKSANKPRTAFTDQTTTQSLSPFGGAKGQDLLNLGLGGAAMNYMRPITPYPELPQIGVGSLISPAAQDLMDRVSRGAGWLGIGRDWFNDVLKGDAAKNPHLNELADNLSRESTETFLESTVPFERSRFAMGGHYASGLADAALATAQEEHQESVDNAISQLFSQGFNDYLDTQAAAAGMLPSYESAALMGDIAALNAMMQASTARAPLALQAQLANQQNILGEFAYNEGLPDQRLSNYLGAILPILSGFGETTSRTQGQNVQPGLGVSPFGMGLQGLLGGTSIGKGLFGGNTAQPSGPVANPFGYQPGGLPYGFL